MLFYFILDFNQNHYASFRRIYIKKEKHPVLILVRDCLNFIGIPEAELLDRRVRMRA